MTKWVVIAGHPIEWSDLFGPFDSGEDAIAWAEIQLVGQTWWVIKLTNPGSIDNE